MENNKYQLAGWLAIAQAVMFPVAFVIGIMEQIVAGRLLGVRRPIVGPSDLLMIVFTAIAVYTLLMFRKLLHERYQYHDLDLLIMISIWWAVVFQVIGLGLGFLVMIFWPVDTILMVVTYFVFLTGAMVTIGIVDIMIAAKLLKIKETLSEYVRGFAYVTMAAGVCEVTVLLVPFAMLLVPVSAVMLALVFFRDRQGAEFV